MDSSFEKFSLWTAAILLGSLVLFSLAKPRLAVRLEQIQSRSTFQVGRAMQSVGGSDNSLSQLSSHEATQRASRTLTNIQLALLALFMVAWIIGLRGLVRSKRLRDVAKSDFQTGP